jgi:hypothetical protein
MVALVARRSGRAEGKSSSPSALGVARPIVVRRCGRAGVCAAGARSQSIWRMAQRRKPGRCI